MNRRRILNNTPYMTLGRLYVMSAPSGTGKTTVIRELLRRLPALVLSVSYTTRAPRAGECNGVDYHFVDRTEFQRMIAADEFLEWAEVHGNRYGTGKSAIRQLQAAGRDVLLDIDVQGGRAVRAWDPEACLIFLLPPSLDELRTRLQGRNTESPESLARRLAQASQEIAERTWYDHVVTNDTIESAVTAIAAVIAPRGGACG